MAGVLAGMPAGGNEVVKKVRGCVLWRIPEKSGRGRGHHCRRTLETAGGGKKRAARRHGRPISGLWTGRVTSE